MEIWEEQLKDDVNQSMPRLIDMRVEETLNQLPRKNKKKKVYLGFSAAIVALSTIFGLTILSPTFANTMKEIPVIGSAFEFIGNIGVKKGKDEGLTTELGEQIIVDRQIITFTETLYDGGEIHIGYIMQGNPKYGDTHFINNLELSINGKPIGSYGMGGHEAEIENGQYAGTLSIRVRDEEIPDSFVLGIRSSKGRSWSVELPVEKKGEQQTFLVNQIVKNKDLTVLFDKITLFPTSTEISLQLMIDEKAYNEDKYGMLDYQVIDDKGLVLQPLSSGGGGGGPVNGKVIHQFEHYYEPLNTLPSSLTIKPYLIDLDETPPQIERTKWEGEEIVVSQGEMGHVTILESTVENGITTFTYEVEGDDLYRQANAIWFEDSSGTRFDSEQPAARVNGSINQYQISFSETPDFNDLYIFTETMNPPNYLEELEVTIELKE